MSGRKKEKLPLLFIPPRPEEFIPEDPASGICLLCDKWLGIDCKDDDNETEPTKNHYTKAGPPFTPHIIVSPDIDVTPPNFGEDASETETPQKDPVEDSPIEDEKSAVAEESVEEVKDVTQESPRLENTFHFPEHVSHNGVILEEEYTPDINGTVVYPDDHEVLPIEDDLQMYENHNKKNELMSNFRPPAGNVSKHVQTIRTESARESLLLSLSALYGKLIVVMGMAFPIAEVISSDVPLVFYNVFYLFLYIGSILFLIYAYLFLLRVKSLPTTGIKNKLQHLKGSLTNLDVKLPEIPVLDSFRQLIFKKKEQKDKLEKEDGISVVTSGYKRPKYTLTESSNHGSMYLKMGAVVFGVGSMIYSGLEFGQYFELIPDIACGNVIMAITPVARMLFTFLQMYFIFLNSRVAISKHTNIARFGLMHMIATNLCIWQSVLVQETKHEISHLMHGATYGTTEDSSGAIIGDKLTETIDMTSLSEGLHNKIVKRDIANEVSTDCRRANLMGAVVSSASPFLFPCTIEYSLLCAGVLYVMWKNINALKAEKSLPDGDSDISNFIARKVRHHYSVDCARASKGLFIGIFILVLTIISLILFYVLISNEEYKKWAILEANIIEVTIYSMAIISLLIGMSQMRQLEFIGEGDIELDNILLLIAQGGVYIYTSFTIIGGCFTLEESPLLPMITSVLTLMQTTLQTIFILDGSRRCCYTADQHDKKPGREIVTFLLVCNLAMWAISTFETSRADAHPVQMEFYGIWAWTIISHVSMPLAIFYRFHVTVCLGEIWKRAYKVKQEFYTL